MRKISLFVILLTIVINLLAQNSREDVNLLILQKDYHKALQKSNDLITSYPDSAYYFYQTALINRLMYRYSKALETIEKAVNLDSTSVEYLTEYGIILDKKDKEQQATKYFQSVFRLDSTSFYAGIWLGNYYLKSKQIDEALHILNTLYSTDTSNAYIARHIGFCWYKKGKYENSKKWFSRTIDLDSTDIKAYRYLFSTYAGKEEFELAFEVIDKAIQIEPTNKLLYVSKGDLHVIRNHNYQALPVYLKAFEIAPDDEDLARKIGLCYYKTKRYQKSKKYLLIAHKGSLNLDVCKHLGYIYKKENKPDSSNFFFNRSLEVLSPDNNLIFTIYVQKAENYYALEDYDMVINYYNRALKLELRGIWVMCMRNEVFIDLASVYSDKLQNYHKAIECLEQVTSDSKIFFNKEHYYTYAQKEIARLKEELFFEGKLN
jgi:tetratricopeptide (TPR) repeat protein